MKIGILTFHNALNFGATLQAYALCEYLKCGGHQAEIINYLNPKTKKEIGLFYSRTDEGISDRLLRYCNLPARLKSIKSYRRFFNENMTLSGNIISTAEELSLLCEKYDKIIVGSDQIFNYNGTGEDFNFYLDFLRDNNKKTAYAPSFGLKEVDGEHYDRVKRCLLDFNSLSAREQSGVEIIKKLTGTDVPLVCDPTFLLDKNQWCKIAAKPKISKPYILIYSFGSRHLDRYAEQLAKQKNAISVNINRAIPCFGKGRKNIYGISPAEFLGLILNADHIVTCSFHGMVLSIVFEKDFTLYKNEYPSAENTNLRFDSLAETLSLQDRIKCLGAPPCTEPIDYKSVNKAVSAWRKQSTAYIKSALGEDL